MPRPKVFTVGLSDVDRAELTRLVTTGSHPARMIMRARVLLELDENAGPVADRAVIADRVGVAENTVRLVARRFVETDGDVEVTISRQQRLVPPVPAIVTGGGQARLSAVALLTASALPAPPSARRRSDATGTPAGRCPARGRPAPTTPAAPRGWAAPSPPRAASASSPATRAPPARTTPRASPISTAARTTSVCPIARPAPRAARATSVAPRTRASPTPGAPSCARPVPPRASSASSSAISASPAFPSRRARCAWPRSA